MKNQNKRLLTGTLLTTLLFVACGSDTQTNTTPSTSGGTAGSKAEGTGGLISQGGSPAGEAGAPAAGSGQAGAPSSSAGAGGEAGAGENVAGGGIGGAGGEGGAPAGAGGISNEAGAAGSAGAGGHGGEVSEACPSQVTYQPVPTQSLGKVDVLDCEGASCFGYPELPLMEFCDNTGDDNPNADCRITIRRIDVEATLDTRTHLVSMRVSQNYLAEPFVSDRVCFDTQALKRQQIQWSFDAVPGPLDEKGCPTFHWMYGNKAVGTAIQTSGLAGAITVPILTCTADPAPNGINGYQTFVMVMHAL